MPDIVDLIGKPYKVNARGENGEFDCYGLAMEIQRRRGVLIPDFFTPDKREDIHRQILAGQELFVKLEQPEPWCLVTLILRHPLTSHVGTILPDCNRFVHILKDCRVVIERLDSLTWQKRISGYFKYEQNHRPKINESF